MDGNKEGFLIKSFLMHLRCRCIQLDNKNSKIKFFHGDDDNGIKPLKVCSSPSLNHQISLHAHFRRTENMLDPQIIHYIEKSIFDCPHKRRKNI